MTGLVGHLRAREAGLELARMLATLLWVAATAALSLVAIGALPAWIAGEERGVRRVATIEEAERRLGARILVPGYFPARLAWPPAEIRVAGGRRGSVELRVLDRAGAPALQLLEATDEGAPLAPELRGAPAVLSSRPTTLGALPARLSEVLVDGHPWHELAWELRGRPMVLRTRGELDELYRIAHSTHREGGR